MDSDVEVKIAETAFCWLEYGNYGSETKAIRALLKRKGIGDMDPATARERLATAAAVLARAKELRPVIARSFGKADVFYLAKHQFEEGSDRLKAMLHEEFPELEATNEYMVGMVWNMPYWR